MPKLRIAFLLLALPLPAQDTAETEAPKNPHAARFRAACEQTLAAQVLEFESRHRPTRNYDFRTRKIKDTQSDDHIAKGLRRGELLYHKFDKNQELVRAGRSMLAKDAQHGWTPRLNCRADASALPFLLDPDQLLRLLAAQADKVSHRGAGQLGNMPVEFFGLQLSGEPARALAFAGTLPTKAQSTPKRKAAGIRAGGAAIQAFNFIGGRRGQQAPKVHVDLVVAVDPTQKRIVRILGRRAMPHRFGGLGGNIFVAGGAPGAAAEEEEKPKKKARPGTLEHALPALNKDDGTKLETIRFEYRFSAKAELEMPELSPALRRLLGLR